MIDYEEAPRDSGKTRELIKLYQQNPGQFFCFNYNQMRYLQNRGIKKDDLSLYSEPIDYSRKYFYFDEFFANISITAKEISYLDMRDKNIFIRGTTIGKNRKYCQIRDYISEHHPENLI